ncbi:MAG: SDR family oxidoreductase [Rhodothermales bacterium]
MANLSNSMKGKVCIVTGANSGIGLETARGLAQAGATVVLACRNEQKGQEARADITSTTGNPNIHLMLVNLDEMASIRAFASAFKKDFNRLDVLVNNAGVIIPRRKTTVDGFEATFAVNHLAYFLLTHLLLDVLKATPKARIVNVSSDAHRAAKIDFADLQAENGYAGYKIYARSKLANILFTSELARQLTGQSPTVNSLHPGVVATNFAKGESSFFTFFFRLFSPFFLSSTKGAQTSLYLATSPEVEGVTGKYFDRSAEKKPSAAASDQETAKRLYEISAKLTGVAITTDTETSPQDL